jgi:predicted phosphodiesterase
MFFHPNDYCCNERTARQCQIIMLKSVLLAVIVAVVLSQEIVEHEDYLDAINHEYRQIALDESIILQVAPQLLEKSGDEVTVTFHGVPSPHKDDWVAAFSPGDVKTIPIRYRMAEHSKDYLKTGSGSLLFSLVNQRAEYKFAFMRGGLSHPTVAAISSPINFKQGALEPTGPHVALTNKLGEMRVVWTSASVQSPTVKWGTDANMTHSAAATSNTYTREKMCGGKAKTYGWRDPGYLHTAVMTGLAPATKYHYIVGDAHTNTWSGNLHLYTPHTTGNTHVIIFGDMGQAPRDGSDEVEKHRGTIAVTKQISKEVAAGNVDVTLHIGDISYARGYAQLWDEFMYDIKPVASKVAYMMSIGNHEVDYPGTDTYFKGPDSGGECGVPYDHRFPMVRNTEKYPDRLWYSFDMGFAHYVIFDTEHDFTHGSAQHAWIEKDLQHVNRTKTPWLVVAAHRPMYCASVGQHSVSALMRKNLEKMFNAYKVDIAFWGHHHSYQRTCAVFGEKCEKTGAVHIVVGTGGVGLPKSCEHPAPHYYEHVDCDHFGYGRMRITKDELAFEFVGTEGNVRDQVTLKK